MRTRTHTVTGREPEPEERILQLCSVSGKKFYVRTTNHTRKVVSFNVHAESLYLAFNFSTAPWS